jgi:hypothetical protein
VRRFTIYGVVLGSILIGGCASITHQPVAYHPYPIDLASPVRAAVKAQNEQEDQNLTGVRYYESSTYLLVYTDGKGNLLWKLYNLPDPTKLMVATPQQVLAKVVNNLTFTNGVLTTSHAEADSTAIPKAVIGALEKVLPFLAAADISPSTTIASPRLYKIVLEEEGWLLVGGKGDQDIRVSLKPEK